MWHACPHRSEAGYGILVLVALRVAACTENSKLASRPAPSPHLWLLDQRPLNVRAVCNLVQQHGAAEAMLGGEDLIDKSRLAGAQVARDEGDWHWGSRRGAPWRHLQGMTGQGATMLAAGQPWACGNGFWEAFAAAAAA
jgi:hypothetical protein